MTTPIVLRPIGVVRSSLKSVEDAPRFYTEDAPPAVLEIHPRYRRALLGLRAGMELIVITWLHRARRDLLTTYPRGDRSRPRRGVFLTRSPSRPNPLGLHRCQVLEVGKKGIWIRAIEVIDGTPIVDLKRVVEVADDS